MPLAGIGLIICEPVVCAIAVFCTLFERTYVCVAIGVQFISQSTIESVVIVTFKDVAVVQEGYSETVESVQFLLFLDCDVF
jgi:hypothetical protein